MKYRNVIWTNHILERMKERKLSYDQVYWIFTKPDQIKESTAKSGYKFYRKHNSKRYALVAKKNEKGEWLFLSCWIKDFQSDPKQKPLSFWGNLWKMIRGR